MTVRRTAGDGDAPASVTLLVRDAAGPLALARRLADHSADAVLLADTSGVLIHANPAARELFTLDARTLREQDLKILVPGCPRQLAGDSQPRSWRARISLPDGTRVEIENHLFTLDPPRCSVVALLAVRQQRAPDVRGDRDGEPGRWASAAQGSSDGFWQLPDAAADACWWSPRMYEMLGYDVGALEPRFSTIVERMHPRDREGFLAEREHALREETPLDTEVRLRHRNGEYRNFRVRAVVARSAPGQPVALSGSFQDVTALRAAVDALESSRARMRDSAAAASDFFFEIDEKLCIRWLSENFQAVTGTDPDTVIGQPVGSAPPNGIAAPAWERFRELLEHRERFRDHILERTRPQARTLYLSLSAQPIIDAAGSFRGYRGCGTDATRRIVVENALKESEEKYRTIVEADHDAVLLADASEFRILDANAAAVRLFGLKREDLLSTELTALDADPERSRSFLRSARDGTAAPRREARMRNQSGEDFPAEISARPVRLADRDAVVCMVRDVSDREHALKALKESEARLKALVDNSPFEIYLKDVEGRYVLVNPTAQRAWGRATEEIIGRCATDIFGPRSAARSAAEDAAVLSSNAPLALDNAVERGGRSRDMYRVKFPISDASGTTAAIGAIAHDQTDRKQALTALEESERRFRDFAELAADYLWEVDTELRYTYVSERSLELTGVPAQEMLGKRGSEIFENVCDDPQVHAAHLENLRMHRPTSVEYTRTRPDGTARRVFLRCRPRFDDNGEFIGWRGITRDITEGHEMSVRLAYQATHDALTGLVNRAEFERRLSVLLESARQDGSSHALCYLDLDQFKVVNDTCGHVAGDALLERLSETLTFRVRQRDTIARLGGDEFGVLIEHCSVAQATRVANVLHQAVSEFVFTWEGKPFQVGASLGLVPITPDLGDTADVLAAADSACYVAKDQGRNRIHVYSKDDVELSRRRGEMSWVSHISGALSENRFRLRAQPVVPLQARHAGAHHCELLLVMLDADGNEVAPGAFLPAAERYNLATRIDRWVVNAALDWLSRNSDGRGRPALCGINLSAHSLGEKEFLDFIRSECERHNIPPSRLCFEITETAAIANLDIARRFISELKSDGAQFALDDFGKGLSSFGYLRELPVDFIKIDAQFVRDLLTDPIDLAMVRSINEVARLMRKRTIAEGVECHDTLRKLREVGVDYAQGYAIGAARPVIED